MESLSKEVVVTITKKSELNLELKAFVFFKAHMDVTECLSLSLCHFLFIRSLGTSGRRERGEPQAQVWEPSPGSVHWEPHVCLQRLSDHRLQKQTEVKEDFWPPLLHPESVNYAPWRPGLVYSLSFYSRYTEQDTTVTCYVYNAALDLLLISQKYDKVITKVSF